MFYYRGYQMKSLIIKNDPFRILQFTDIHLMNMPTDDETFRLMNVSILETAPELIIITGDITMTYNHQALLEKLRDFIDCYFIPWTFVFGNHDHEGSLSLSEQADILMQGNYCYFEKGNPHLKGIGNHYISLNHNGKVVSLIGLLDTHDHQVEIINEKEIWLWDHLEHSQINEAYETIESLKQSHPDLISLFFFHIPITEFKTQIEQALPINGSCYEQISSSNYNSQFFNQIIQTKTLKGVFVGHDHVCDFSFEKEGCLLAFGRCTGHYNYTMPEFTKGARIIDIDSSGNVSSWVYLEK